MTNLFSLFKTKTASLFRSGQQESESVDPFANAVELAQNAEKRAKSVSDMLQVSTQWLAIAQIHQELSSGMMDERPRQVGFTGGKKDDDES